MFLTLPSNSSMDIFPDNTVASFRTKLPGPLELGLGDWEVGLSEIILPKTWNNITGRDHAHIAVVTDAKTPKRLNIPIPQGRYASVKNLLGTCNNALRAAGVKEVTFRTLPDRSTIGLEITQGVSSVILGRDIAFKLGFSKFAFSGPLDLPSKLQVELSLKSEVPEAVVVVVEDDSLHQPLAFGLTKSKKKKTTTLQRVIYVTSEMPKLDQGAIFIYCDLVRARPVGDSVVPLLRVLATSRGVSGDLIAQSFQPIHYLPVNRSSFDTVEVHIRHDTGDPVAFQSGKVIITLHFRRR